MWRNLFLPLALLTSLLPAPTHAQDWRKTVTLEVYLPESARLFIEGREMKFKAPMHRFVSPPLAHKSHCA